VGCIAIIKGLRKAIKIFFVVLLIALKIFINFYNIYGGLESINRINFFDIRKTFITVLLIPTTSKHFKTITSYKKSK
jgi:hypothetical protein